MSSSLPAAYTALHTLAKNTFGQSVQVSEGQVGVYIAGRQLLIADAQGQDMPMTLGHPTGYSEQYAITLVAHSWEGGQDTAARRVDAMSIYSTFRDAINADRSLGQPQPFTANVGTYQVAAGFDENGVSSQVQFDVVISNLAS